MNTLKNGVAALSVSVAMSMTGCHDHSPEEPSIDTSKPTITAPASTHQVINTTQWRVVKTCNTYKLRAPLLLEELEEWLKGCDMEVQNALKQSTTWKKLKENIGHDDVKLLQYRIRELNEIVQLLSKLDIEWQTIIKNSITWKKIETSPNDDHVRTIKYMIWGLKESLQTLSKLDTKHQTLIRNSSIWKDMYNNPTHVNIDRLKFKLHSSQNLSGII